MNGNGEEEEFSFEDELEELGMESHETWPFLDFEELDAGRLAHEVERALEIGEGDRRSFRALTSTDPWWVTVEFDGLSRETDGVHGMLALLGAVHPDPDMRALAQRLEQGVAEQQTELSLDPRVFEQLAKLDPQALKEDGRRILEHGLRDYRRAGVDKDEATRDKIRDLKKDLVDIGQRFDSNIAEATGSIRIPEGHAGLAGLPADYLATHPEDADGSVTVTTNQPDAMPFFMYAERADLRRELFREYQRRAYPENIAVLEDLLCKRHELARVLGYESWADYATEDKMVATKEAAKAFIRRVSEACTPKAREEYEELLALKRVNEPATGSISESEKAYWIERAKRERFDFDSQSVRPYFPYEAVKVGIIELVERLYGVDVFHRVDLEAWHPSVETFDVAQDGHVIGRFHLDMFPREGKYKGAAMFPLLFGQDIGPKSEAALVCNFPQPSGDDPGLLLHSQVKTFFHEFGHLVHQIFARTPWLRFSGVRTEWDFVEVPSQLFEEWAWSPAVLQTFAHHHETGEPIPTELVERMRAASEYGKGLWAAGQSVYATYSMALYEADPTGLDTDAVLREVKRSVWPIEHEEGTHLQAAFGHLNAYNVAYYTYMWSLVIAKDAFGAFGVPLDSGDREVSRRWRAEVLDRGGEADGAEMVRSFLGREYSFDAWEAWLAR